MTPREQKELQEHLQAIATILYRHTDEAQLQDFEQIETTVRQQVLTHISPTLGEFFCMAANPSGVIVGER